MELGKWMIVEADESDGSFLRLPHEINIITNLDLEHLDYYKNKDNLIEAFKQFINNLPFYGYSILCIDNNELNKISKQIKTRKIITYSYKNKNSDVIIKSIKNNKTNTEFKIFIKKNVILNIEGYFYFKSNLLGNHNVLNATAAIISSLLVRAPIKKIQKALSKFEGVKRRFTYLGSVDKALIYDDYAHHPSEIEASYQIAKQIAGKKIIIIFQPHRYTRTKYLYNDFIKILRKIDILYIQDIYPAGEKSIKNINSKNIVKKLQTKKKRVYYLSKKDDIRLVLHSYFREKNIIIFMGAGSITYDAHKLIKDNYDR